MTHLVYKTSLFIVLLFIKVSSGFASLKTDVDSAVDQYLASHFLNGIFMFEEKDKILKIGAKGLFSLKGDPLKANQPMPIASGTKPMTAFIILRLQEQGLLNVKDNIARYLDSSIWLDGKTPAFANQLTLHNLLTHSSGLKEYIPALKIDTTKKHTEINKDIANFAASAPLSFEPGTKFEYINTNFVLLGMIIERITGKSLKVVFDEEIFKPLDMTNSHMGELQEAIIMQNDPEKSPYPTRYFVTPTSDKPIFNSSKVDFTLVPYADGGVISTPKDLIKWHQALHTGKLLNPKSYKMMLKRYLPIPDDNAGHKGFTGYGIVITELENGIEFYHHPGSAVAIRSESGYVPSKDFYYAIISNVMEVIPAELKEKIDLTLPANQLDILYFREAILKAINA